MRAVTTSLQQTLVSLIDTYSEILERTTRPGSFSIGREAAPIYADSDMDCPNLMVDVMLGCKV